MDLSIQSFLEVSEGLGDIAEASGARPSHDNAIVLRDCLVANYERLYCRLLRHLGCQDLASDCLHDAWLRLGDTMAPAALRNPEAYVYRVCCNLAMDHLRSKRSSQYRVDVDTELDYLADPAPGPDLVAEARSNVAAVDRAMEQLPRRHRAVLLALRVEELTRKEVADRYGLSLRCVETVLRQALDYCAEQTSQPRRTRVNRFRRGPSM